MADRAALYCRLSVNVPDAPTLDSQETLLREYCAPKGYDVIGVFRESHTGAELRERPTMRQVLELADQRAFDVLVVRDLDRLTRSMPHLWVLKDHLEQRSARVEFALQSYEDTPEGRLMMNVQAFMAEVEREKIRWRTMTGRRRRLETGKLAGAGPEKYGYLRDKESGRRSIVEDEAATVRQLYEWVDDGMSATGIWRRLVALGTPPPGRGKIKYAPNRASTNWSATQVRRILTDPTYKGESYGWTWRAPSRGKRERRPVDEWIALPAGTTPAIVSPVLWERVQRKLSAAGGTNTRNLSRPALLRGLIRCLVCGYAMHTHKEGRTGFRVYRCGSRQRAEGKCDGGRYVRAEACEAWVWERVCEWIKRADVMTDLAEHAATVGPTRAATKHADRLAQLYAQQRRWLDLYGDTQSGVPPDEIRQRLADVAANITATKALLDAEQPPQDAPAVSPTELTAFLAEWQHRVDALDFSQRRAVLDWLEARVLGSGREWRLTTRGGLVVGHHRERIRR